MAPRVENDEVFWRWQDKGVFTVRSTYAFISNGGLRDLYARSLWSLRTPPRVQILCWLILKKSLLTTDKLHRRGWVGNTLCVLCGGAEETIDHLFVRCVFSQFVLGSCLGAYWSQGAADDVRGVWERLMPANFRTCGVRPLYFLSAAWSVIWEFRNRVIFDNASIDPLDAVRRVNREVPMWRDLLLGG